MKTTTMNLLAGLLFASASSAVLAIDDAACRDGYSIMLLTQNECKTWVSTHARLKKQGDNIALNQLNEKMRSMIVERAEVCPCAWDQVLKEKILQKNAGF